MQAAHQQITREWWERRQHFELFVSEVVLAEAVRGDVEAANRRMAVLDEIQVLAASADASELAELFVRAKAVPRKAMADAVHIAVAAVNGMDYVLTWNCRHIANAAIRSKIEHVCRDIGLEPPIICTPEELME
ncbi:MAG: type II toxin-antitoxin system VapC family toxin [Vicinamibacterales bacterium]